MHPGDLGFRRNARPAKTFCCRRIVGRDVLFESPPRPITFRARAVPVRQNLPELPNCAIRPLLCREECVFDVGRRLN
jgi:hypothetical protein